MSSRHLLALLLLLPASAARADRDIVFSAQFYRWSGKYHKDSFITKPEQTLADKTGLHLFRINPDGSGLRQITDGKGSEFAPTWSPDGRSIAFLRSFGEGKKSQLIISDELGRRQRTLARLDARHYTYGLRLEWSPDGHAIAAGSEDTLTVVDCATGRVRTWPRVTDFAWSPDSRTMALVRAPDLNRRITEILDLRSGRARQTWRTILNPVWISATRLMGDAPPQQKPADDEHAGYPAVLLYLDRQGRLREERTLHPFSPSEEMFDDSGWGYSHTRVWAPLNRPRTRWAMQNFHGMSDGAHYVTYVVDTALRRYRELGEFSLVAVAPEGKRLLVAEHEWIGPYKRRGRRCGALEMLSLPLDRRKSLTTKLVSIEGGDWRRLKR